MSQYECYLATSNSTVDWTTWAPTQWQRQWVGIDLSDGSHIWADGQNEYLEKSTSTRTKLNESLKEGIEMKNLYEVFLVYGEDRINPLIHRTADAGYVVAENDEDAKIKSGIFSMIKSEWDADYLTIIVHNLGAVKIKEKAKEVKNV